MGVDAMFHLALCVGGVTPSVAALYVDPTGPYAGRPDVDAWSEERDARTYAGRLPVVVHPPCASWGRYAKLTPASRALGPLLGDDAGCFRAALISVLEYGGVLEHPRDSKAWAAFGLTRPVPGGGWTPVGAGVGVWTCEVEQGHYGHAARKPTWLLYVGARAPFALVWGPSEVTPRPWAKARGVLECMSKRQRRLTPAPFAEVLVRLALWSRE